MSLREVKAYLISQNAQESATPEAAADAVNVRDWDQNSLCVVIRCPNDIAAQVPYKPDDTSPPHITIAYVRSCPPTEIAQAIDALLLAFAELAPFEVVLHGLDYFRVDFDNRKVAYTAANFSTDAQAVHNAISGALRGAGCEPSQYTNTERFTPHLTLAYLADLETYKGPVPQGSWQVDALEIWHGAERIAFALGSAQPVDA